MMRSGRLLAVLATCILCAPAALAQQAAPAAQAPAAIEPHQPPLDQSMQKYQQAMIECYREMVPHRDPKNTEPVDPSAFKMDSERTRKMSKCMADKDATPPINPYIQESEAKYFKKGLRNSQAGAVSVQSLAIQNRVRNMLEKSQSDAYEEVYGKPPPAPLLGDSADIPESSSAHGPAVAEEPKGPSGTGSYSPVSAAGGKGQPSLYNAPPNNPAAGGGSPNNNSGGGPLWLPQSQ